MADVEQSQQNQQYAIPNSIEEAPEIYREQLTVEEQAFYLKMKSEDIQQYREIFDIFDETGDGNISNDEIGKVMQGLGENPTPERIASLVAQIDYDGNGEVDFDEFVCLMVKTVYEADKAEEELVEVFHRFDRDQDGDINEHDLLHMFRELGYATDEAEAKDMIHFFDKDGDGRINFAEFVQLMMSDDCVSGR